MKAIYYDIYEDLRDKIMEGTYPYQTYIPSELQLIEQYECSHNTARKALAVLQLHGFVQPIRGKGVLVIWRPRHRTRFVLGELQSFAEAAEANGLQATTQVRVFEHLTCDERLADMTGFPLGTDLLHLERVRRFDGANLIWDRSVFLAEAVPGITPEIAESSVFAYLEGELGMQVTTSQRTITMEYATATDREVLDLLDFDMLAVWENHNFDASGRKFEVTQSRHRPDYFTFHTTAVRGY